MVSLSIRDLSFSNCNDQSHIVDNSCKDSENAKDKEIKVSPIFLSFVSLESIFNGLVLTSTKWNQICKHRNVQNLKDVETPLLQQSFRVLELMSEFLNSYNCNRQDHHYNEKGRPSHNIVCVSIELNEIGRAHV